MSRPDAHKKRLLKYITKIMEEVCQLRKENHIDYLNKSLHELELDIHSLIQEIERKEFL